MADQLTLPLTGGCPCEAVRFEVTEPLVGAVFCHCKRCQRRTGTAFSVTALTVPRFPERITSYTEKPE